MRRFILHGMRYGNSAGSSRFTKGEKKNFQAYQPSHPATTAIAASTTTFKLSLLNTIMMVSGVVLVMEFAIFVA